MIDRRRLMLSVQRALLGEVTPRLRAVVADGGTIRAFYDGEPTEDDRESMSIVETEVLADFDPGDRITVECVRLDSPARVAAPGEWIYRRKEP